MILKASQRSGKGLARHLLDSENDFVEVHEVSGFLSDDLTGAFKEIEAISMGTKCRQPFFSISISPPADAKVTVEMFEDAANRIAEANGLTGQPRVIVFHEKESRRHAHLVISRIDAETMTAKNLPHFKNKLQALSRDLFIENEWNLPPGMRDRTLKSPTNVTLAEWQSAKRRGKNAIDQKKLIQQCWAASDSKAGFEAALKDHGYILAKGNRRSHVIVCHDGEIMAVARSTGQKTKAVRERLGDADQLPSVEQAMQQHKQNVRGQFVRMAGEVRCDQTDRRRDLENQRRALIAEHKQERQKFDKGQKLRWDKECITRQRRFKTGLGGLWQRLTGQQRRIEEQNTAESHAALVRDRDQRQRLIQAQHEEQNVIQKTRVQLRQQAFGLIDKMRSDRDRLIAKLSETPTARVNKRATRRQPANKHEQGPDFDFDM
ncbi:hypothetical protein A9Q94_06485 [Rhodobacterales bacterium 56_14_T64]|nr:hypothetical protein A9Q94_06485 [Rhodobacterales bacterium 56_14_T64]